ncbi:MAG TPA: multiheme c-type cytochrome [Gemmataceae bacterium]|nr:multiheme c-type cytochrome [Gemmataceae bacterium]
MADDCTQNGPRVTTRRTKLLAAGVAATAAVAVAACFVSRGPTVDPTADDGKAKERVFRDWPKPDLLVVVSGQQHGYMEPCGCSRPQIGGLDRRYNFIEGVKGRGWPVLAVDVGDIAQRKGPAGMPNVQGLVKYKYSMMALKQMKYPAVSFGSYEAAMPLIDALTAFTLNNNDPSTGKPLPPFVLAANLDKKEESFPGLVESWKIVDVPDAKLKIGVVGVVGPSVAKEIKDPAVRLTKESDVAAIRAALKAMESDKPDLRVLLYQGQPEEARAIAKEFPSRFPVIACISTFDEPPSNAEIVKEAGTIIVTVGHKGKYVGAVGINRTGKDEPKFELRYQLVRLGEEYLISEGKEKGHPILDLLEEYTKELKRENYLAKYYPSKHPSQAGKKADEKPVYVGSDKCRKCHEHAYEIWKTSPHFKAYEALVKAEHPSNRQYDGECVVCHTVGFGYESGFRNEKDTPNLINVGCESCHGPGSQHVKNANNAAAREALNPWKGDARRIEIDLCVKCHDPDNDVHWSFDKWKKIIHDTPRDE